MQRVAPRGIDRRAALRRADRLLESLSRVQIALLEAEEGDMAWADLAAMLGEEGHATGSSALDQLIEAIELRAAVEMAKHEVRRQPGRR